MNKTYVTDYGGTGKAVVLLHGFVSSSKYWKNIQPKLSKMGYHVITIDLLGFGDAPKPKDIAYSYDDHVAHLHDAMAHLAINRPFTLVGHSLGGLLAIRYALRYEHEVESLVLLHPPIYKDREQVRETLRSTGRFYRALLDSRYKNYLWIIMRNIGPFGKHASYSRERTLANVIERAELLDDLQKVNIRTLLLVGTKDRKEYATNLSNRRTNPNISVAIEHIGHHSPRLSPDLVMQYLADFIHDTGKSVVKTNK